MRSIIKRALEYFLHEHDLEKQHRIITYRQKLVGDEFESPGTWLQLTWVQKCRTCGATLTNQFNSGL